jgi:hypothetical protein
VTVVTSKCTLYGTRQKNFSCFLPSFKVKIVPHALFLPEKLFYAVINVLYTRIWSLELPVTDGLLGKA